MGIDLLESCQWNWPIRIDTSKFSRWNCQKLNWQTKLTHAFLQFRPEEWLEQREYYVEHIRLINYVNIFNSQWHCVLQPIDNSLCERWRELPGLLNTETVHVEYNDSTGDLRSWLQHRSFQIKHATFEHFVETALVVLPLFSKLDNQYTTTVLIAIRQHREYVVIENILFATWLETVVDVRVLHFEGVILFDELHRGFWIVLCRTEKTDQPGLVVHRTFEIGLGCNF